MASTIAPLLGGLFLVLAVGALLRFRGGMGTRDADTLNRLIMDVTMPALLVDVLSRRSLEIRASSGALLASTIALASSCALGFLVAKIGRGDRKAQGASFLTSAFSNTGFLGFPLIVALFAHDDHAATASSTAIVIDTCDTTLLLWTVGIAIAQNLGDPEAKRSHVATTLRAFARPLTFALVVGVGVHALDIALPAFLGDTLALVGKCTTPLVFLALGLQLDIKAVAARAPLVAAATAVKLVASPLVALLVVRVLHVAEPAASAAVLQSAMPSAMASVIVAAQTQCDRSLAAGVATLTTIACIATLPAVGFLLDVTR